VGVSGILVKRWYYKLRSLVFNKEVWIVESEYEKYLKDGVTSGKKGGQLTKVYLAIPYSHPNPEVREIRFRIANEVAGRLMLEGYVVFSPISHSHPIEETCGINGDYTFWLLQDKHFIDWCDKLIVVTIYGWKKSIGVTEEIRYAESIGKEVEYYKYEKDNSFINNTYALTE
jgi:hypothetical protein